MEELKDREVQEWEELEDREVEVQKAEGQGG